MRKLLLIPAAAALLTVARAADPPPLQEGLWEIRGQSIANPGSKRTGVHLPAVQKSRL